MRENPTILVVDDEHGVRQSFQMVLEDRFELAYAESGQEALAVLARQSVDLMLLDILLPDISGIEVLRSVSEVDPHVEVIMITAVNEISTAVQAIKLGAFEYIMKPFHVEELQSVIDRALEKRRLVKEVAFLRHELNRLRLFEKMVGKDPRMKSVFQLIEAVAPSDGAVLIQGESGTGKELVARAIHNRSPRKEMPFVVVNCSAIPPSLMESELFGFIKGAFTGAVANGTGKLEIADKGCVFLDDIDSLDTRMQAKLLRIIQEKEFQRLGSPKTYRIDTRFIAASNKNLSEWIAENRFREDLYYRLNVFPIHLPPLRQRRGDIPLLLEHFLELNVKKTGKPPKHFSQRAVDILSAYEWPGNVRELQNLVERLFTITRSDAIDLCEEPGIRLMPPHMPDKPLKAAVNDFERRYIADVLERVNGSRNRAASILGIHRNTLLSKIKDLGLVPDRSTGDPALNAAG